jgi:hypothetical protein
MKYFLSLLLLATFSPAAINLMPVPAKIVTGEGALPMNAMLRVTMAGYSDGRLASAAERLAMRVSRKRESRKSTGLRMFCRLW